MKKLSMLFMVIFIFGWSATGYSSEDCLLFKKPFKRTTKAPVAQFEEFEALSGKAIVRVYNGAENNEAKKVSSATLFINGQKIIDSSDFNQHVDVIETMADLNTGKNFLEVLLKSKPGGEIAVEIVKPKYLALNDLDCDLIPSDGDGKGTPGDNLCTSNIAVACDDNCPDDYNPDQADEDGDGIGDICDAGDTYPNGEIVAVSVGGNPYGKIAVSPDGAYVYVSNYIGNTISVIKTVDKSLYDKIEVGRQPFGVSVTPDGKYLYESNFNDDDVWVIRTSDKAVEYKIPVGDGPYDISMTPDGAYVYVCNFYDNNVSVIRTSDKTVEYKIPVGDGPYGVSVTPDGKYAYVANNYGNTVSVILTDIHDEIFKIDVGSGPHGISVTPDGKFVYVSNYYGNTVSVIQTDIQDMIHTIENVGNLPFGVSVTPDSAHVYVNNFNDGNVSVIQTSNHSVIYTIDVGNGPSGGSAVSPDGANVYVNNFIDGTVSVLGF